MKVQEELNRRLDETMMDETKEGKSASSWEGMDHKRDIACDEKFVGPTAKTKTKSCCCGCGPPSTMIDVDWE